MATELSETRVSADGLEFACLEAGAGPLALCLHGFPDSAWTFASLLPALADAGFRAVAPFMRGYAPTAVPDDGEYHRGRLARDANALHEALGGDGDAVIVGHDWGAIATYGAAVLEPERWRRVVTMAVPPGIGGEHILQHYEQLKRSFYILLFQLPVAETAVGANDLAFIDGLWGDWCNEPVRAAEMAARAKDCMRAEPNLSAAIGYYRALLAPAPDDLAQAEAAATQSPPQPTLWIQGTEDQALGVELSQGAEERLSKGSRAVRLEGANHFLNIERPDEVDRLVVDWVSG